jgi:DNA-directed RNA polymerase specialized sigma24 family protein
LNEQDGEDLFQDFAFEVLKAEVRYDPERGSYDAFVRGVLDLAYKHFARRLSTRSGRVPRLHPPEDLEASVSASWCPSDISSCDLRVDVQGTIDGLDPETAELAVRLKHQSVAEAAEAMGTHRGTAHRWIAQKLRIAFKSLRPGK